MKSFSRIQGKTLEQIQKNLKSIDMGDLVDFYNKYAGNPKPKKFKMRKLIEIAMDELLTKMIEIKEQGESKASKAAEEAPAISAKGFRTLEMVRRCMKDWQDDQVEASEVAVEMDDNETATRKTLDILTRDGFLINLDEQYHLTELGKTAKAPGKKAATGATKKRGSTGPKSSLSGKSIKIMSKDYAPREGSKRGKAWGKIEDGISYDKYRAAGGNTFDLNFFIQKGYAKLV